jgi:hypothetical protein
MGWVRVAVTRIEHDGTMHRRMVDTVQQSDPRNWEDLAARALAARPPYRPVPGTDVYHICADDYTVQVGEYDLEGPLRDLVTVVLAVGSKMLLTPAPSGPDWRIITRAAAWLRMPAFPRPPDRRRSCRGRSESRWSARSAARTYDLDCDLCAALGCPAREDRPVSSYRRGHRGCVTAGTASGRVRG